MCAGSSPLAVECDVQLLAPLDLATISACNIVHGVLEREGATGEWTVAVVLTTNDHLQQLHRQFLSDDTATDIMTFPYGSPEEGALQGGDIVISVDQAEEQAAELGHDLTQELQFLIAHGVLHLLGWDDQTESTRADMHRRQQQLLERIASAGTD